MRNIIYILTICLMALPAAGQYLTVERPTASGDDDADQVGASVSLTGFSLDAGSSMGVRTYFAVRFRNLPLTPGMLVEDSRIRFVVQSDSIEEVIIKIELESSTLPEDYAPGDYNLTRRTRLDTKVFWPIRGVKRGDTLYTPDLSRMIEELALQQEQSWFTDLSFIFGPEWAVDSTGTTELEVFSTNQSDQERSPRFFMTYDTIYGIDDREFQRLNVFPVPVTKTLHIESSDDRIEALRVIDLNGNVVLHMKAPAHATSPLQLDVSHLAPGCYSIVVNHSRYVSTRHIIIGE